MGLREILKDRLEDRRERFKEELEKEYQFKKDKLEARKEVVNKIVHKPSTMSFEGISNDTEPFSWPRGTVRGIITIWVVLSFCIIVMYSFMTRQNMIPVEWYLGIVAMIISSYFYTRMKMNI